MRRSAAPVGATVLETFAADDDSDAIERAHKLSLDLPCEPRTFAARWGYFRLEREDGHGSQLLFAWVPRDRTPESA